MASVSSKAASAAERWPAASCDSGPEACPGAPQFDIGDDIRLASGGSKSGQGVILGLQTWADSCGAWCLAELGEFQEAVKRGEEARRIAETLDFPYVRGATYEFLGFAYLRQGRLEPAIALLEQCLELSRSTDLPVLLVQMAMRVRRCLAARAVTRCRCDKSIGFGATKTACACLCAWSKAPSRLSGLRTSMTLSFTRRAGAAAWSALSSCGG